MKGRQVSQVLEQFRREYAEATNEQREQLGALLSPNQRKVLASIKQTPHLRLTEIAGVHGYDTGTAHFYVQQCLSKLCDVKTGQGRKQERHSNPRLSILPSTQGRMVSVEEAMERYRMVNQ